MTTLAEPRIHDVRSIGRFIGAKAIGGNFRMQAISRSARSSPIHSYENHSFIRRPVRPDEFRIHHVETA